MTGRRGVSPLTKGRENHLTVFVRHGRDAARETVRGDWEGRAARGGQEEKNVRGEKSVGSLTLR